MEEIIKLFGYVINSYSVGSNPQAFLVLVGLAFARILGFLTIVPFFGGQAVPGRVKVATAAALVLIVYPSIASEIPPAGTPFWFGPVGYIGLLMKESFVGFALGYVAAAAFEAIQTAGRFIDTQRGSSMAEVFAPQVQARVSELGQFKLQFAIVLFLMSGLHRLFLSALLESYVALPALKFPIVAEGNSAPAQLVIQVSAAMFSYGIQMAIAPVIALLMTDLFFGVVNRVAPQVNVFFLSMPVKMSLGIFIFMIALPLYVKMYMQFFSESYNGFLRLIQSLSITLRQY